MKILQWCCCNRSVAKFFKRNGQMIQEEQWSLSFEKLRFPLLLSICAAVDLILSAQIMYSMSALIVSFNADERHKFVIAVWRTLGFVLLQAIATTLKSYCADRSAIQWRDCLEKELFQNIEIYHDLVRNWSSTTQHESVEEKLLRRYSSGFSATVPLYTENIDGLDQRLSQDIIDFVSKVSSIYEKIAVLPAIIVFYSYSMIADLGVLSILLCMLYFLVGSNISMVVAKTIAPLVYHQAKLEAIFRYSCTSYMKHLTTIIFMGGGEREIIKMLELFRSSVTNKILLVNKEFWVRFTAQCFAYAGAVVSYSIVGFSILYPVEIKGFALTKSATTDFSVTTARLTTWSQGSYACMALINAFSTIVESVRLYSEATGLYQRIDQVVVSLDLVTKSMMLALNDIATPISGNAGHLPSVSNRLPDSLASLIRSNIVKLFGESGKERQYLHLLASNTMFLDEAQVESDEFGETDDNNLEVQTVVSRLYAPLMPRGKVSLSLQSTVPMISLRRQLTDPNSQELLNSESDSINDSILEILNYRLFTIDQSKVIIPSLTLTITRGMRILITGPTGCGKSTLLQIIATMIRQINRFSSNSYTTLIVCPQVPYLLPTGTLRENLVYPRAVEDVMCPTEREIWALKTAMLEDHVQFLTESPNEDSHTLHGTQTVEHIPACEKFSTGQRQCLSIARLLYHTCTSTVALLDEVTSAMDEWTEKEIYSAIVRHVPTFVSIGHRSSVRKFHSHELKIRKDGSYSFEPLI